VRLSFIHKFFIIAKQIRKLKEAVGIFINSIIFLTTTNHKKDQPMLWIKNQLSPPVYDNDIDKTMTANLLNSIHLTVTASPIIFMVSSVVFNANPIRSIIINFLTLLLLCGLLVLLRKGYVRQAATGTVIVMFVLFSLVAAMHSGINSPILSGLIPVVMVAGLLLGKRAAYITVFFSSCVGLSLLILNRIDALPFANTLSLPETSRWIILSVFLGISGAFVGMSRSMTNKALLEAEQRLVEQQETQNALRASEGTIRAILEALPDVIFRIDRSGTFNDFIPAEGFETLVPPEEFLGKKVEEILSPELAELTLKNLTITLEENKIQIYEYSIIQDGELNYFEARMVKADRNSVLAVIRDITDRIVNKKHNEEMLSVLERRNTQLRIAAEVAKTCSGILDPDLLVQQIVDHIQKGFNLYYIGLFLMDNEEQTAILHAGSGQAGKSMLDGGYRLDLDEPSMISWCIRNGQARIAQQADLDKVRYPNPLLPDTRSEMALPLISRDRVIGALTVQDKLENAFNESDISSLQTMADQVAIALENARLYSALQAELTLSEGLVAELEKKNAELERFTYTVSHDLKSPLITIRGFLGYLEKDAINGNFERLKSDIERISQAAKKMQLLLEELLELSRVGRLINEPEAIPFEAIVQDALEKVQGQLSSNTVKVEVGSNLPDVYGDRIRLVEVLQNLLDNAAKFMGDQTNPIIEIGVRQEEGENIFFVKDNGLGIEPQFQEKVFGLFDKLDPNSEGTGIGLALVKRIVEVHGGRIWVESAAGIGSTFYFTLPTPSAF